MASSFQPFETRIENIARRFPDSPKQDVVLTRLYFHIFKLLNERQNQQLSEFGLNSTSWLALVMIYSTPDNAINPCELSYAMISSRTNITRLADELVDKEWVERHASKDDRRKIVLSLTPKGKNLVDLVLPIQKNHHQELWADFDSAERKQFELLLRKLLHHIDEPSSEKSPCGL